MTQQIKGSTQRKTRRSASVTKHTKATETRPSFAQTYPAIARWIESYGWIEMGQDDFSRSMVRALDIGGMIWEGKSRYASLDELLRDLEHGLSAWFDENG